MESRTLEIFRTRGIFCQPCVVLPAVYFDS